MGLKNIQHFELNSPWTAFQTVNRRQRVLTTTMAIVRCQVQKCEVSKWLSLSPSYILYTLYTVERVNYFEIENKMAEPREGASTLPPPG
jgi:hypothetical protein